MKIAVQERGFGDDDFRCASSGCGGGVCGSIVAAGAAPADQDDFAGWMQQGKEAVKQGQLQDAEAAFRRAVALEPLSAEALDALAEMVYRSGHKDQFQRVVALRRSEGIAGEGC